MTPFEAAFPWLCGMLMVPIAYLAVGNSLWELAFVIPTVIVGFWVVAR